MSDVKNPCMVKGIAFVEFAGGEPGYMERVFRELGFSLLMKHQNKEAFYYQQNDIHFILNREDRGFATDFIKKHGPGIPSMGWKVENAEIAFETAVANGARPFSGTVEEKTVDCPAIYGIGDSLIYFVDRFNGQSNMFRDFFTPLENPVIVADKGFQCVDHLTNNVYKGTMQTWADFYKNVFGFTEIRYFDIRGKKTGLTSYALQSPCGSFSIPINEGDESKSQIEEYLREYNGPGIQHLALLTNDLLTSLDLMDDIDTLDIDPTYYDTVFQRVPGVREDHDHIRRHQVLVDGDEEGYLLQIFTKNLFGPIFFELIQRNNHNSFGEGNFQSLFNSIERDQEKRGVL